MALAANNTLVNILVPLAHTFVHILAQTATFVNILALNNALAILWQWSSQTMIAPPEPSLVTRGSSAFHDRSS